VLSYIIKMNENERLKLNEMISEYKTEDFTDYIRELKHSSIIRKEVERLVEIVGEEKKKSSTIADIRDASMLECNLIIRIFITESLKKK
jgi:hypothetical protein